MESDSHSHGHGIIERSELRNLCHKWKHSSKLTCLREAENILICHIYTDGPVPVMPWRKLTSTLCTDTGNMVPIWSGDL